MPCLCCISRDKGETPVAMVKMMVGSGGDGGGGNGHRDKDDGEAEMMEKVVMILVEVMTVEVGLIVDIVMQCRGRQGS